MAKKRRRPKRSVKQATDLQKALAGSPMTTQRSLQAISRCLERVGRGGHRPDTVFRAWLDLVEANLTQMPRQLKAIALTGSPDPWDPPEVAALFARLREQYSSEDFEQFSRALAELLLASAAGYNDLLGRLYMTYAYPNPNAGQFFTPYPVAACMAQMLILTGAEDINQRLEEALTQAQAADSNLSKTLEKVRPKMINLESAQTYRWLFTDEHTSLLGQILPYYQPIKVLDPCVGSGVLLLAAAAQYPAWMVHLGLVRFYGIDIDALCVQMTRINCLLYGLNGAYLKHVLEAEAQDLDALPDPARTFYQLYQAAHHQNDQTTLQAMETEVAAVRQQMTLGGFYADP